MRRTFSSKTFLNNHGQGLLITVIITSLFMISLTASHFVRSINEKLAAEHEKDSLKALFYAEIGVESIVTELNHSAPDSETWFTHVVDSSDGKTLVRQNGHFLDTFNIMLPQENELTEDGYASKEGHYIVKVYNDPSDPNQRDKIILSKGISGNSEKIIAARAPMGSLYEYFVFSPGGWTFSQNFIGKGGKIQVNGPVMLFSNANILDVSQFATGEYFHYYIMPDIPPLSNKYGTVGVDVDDQFRTLAYNIETGTLGPDSWAEILGIGGADKWDAGECYRLNTDYNGDGTVNSADCLFDVDPEDPYVPFYNNHKYAHEYLTGYISGDHWGAVCKNLSTGQYDTCTGVYGKTGDWRFVDPLVEPEAYMNKISGQTLTSEPWGGAHVKPYGVIGAPEDGVLIPNRLSTSYRYSRFLYDMNQENTWPAVYTGDDGITRRYAVVPPGTYSDKENMTDCPEEYCPETQVFDTAKQADDFKNFLETAEGGILKGVMMDSNTGGQKVSTPVIEADVFETISSEKGIHIKNTYSLDQWNSTETGGCKDDFGNNWCYRDENRNLDCADENGDGMADNCGKFSIAISGKEYFPDDKGKVKVWVNDTGTPEEITIFEKDGFYNAASTKWVSLVKTNMANLKRAVEHGATGPDGEPLPSLDENIVYSDWPLAVTDAQEVLNGGVTFVSEGPGYFVGDVNTVNYQPTAFIGAQTFYPLSENFDFPKEIRELANHPDLFYVDEYDPVHDQWRQDHYNQLVDRVGKDHTYNISIIGYDAVTEKTLEQWSWEDDWTDPNSADHGYKRTIVGTLLQLPKGAFKPKYTYETDEEVNRRCTVEECNAVSWDDDGNPLGPFTHKDVVDYYTPGIGWRTGVRYTYEWPSCRGCPQNGYCNESNNYCEGWTTKVKPFVWTDPSEFQWEERYLTGNLPPGDLASLRTSGWIVLPNKDVNFNTHCQALQGNVMEITP